MNLFGITTFPVFPVRISLPPIINGISITVFEKKDRLFVLIIDSKVGLTDYDMEVIKIFKDIGIDYVLVANKADKLNQKETSKLKKDITSVLGLDTYVLYSTTKKMGTKELLSIINP